LQVYLNEQKRSIHPQEEDAKHGVVDFPGQDFSMCSVPQFGKSVRILKTIILKFNPGKSQLKSYLAKQRQFFGSDLGIYPQRIESLKKNAVQSVTVGQKIVNHSPNYIAIARSIRAWV